VTAVRRARLTVAAPEAAAVACAFDFDVDDDFAARQRLDTRGRLDLVEFGA
jgi:hypothetical protein